MVRTMTPAALQARMRRLAVAVIRLAGELPRTRIAEAIGGQLVRSATSVAANYRSACRARSPREFVAKLGIVEEEAAFWLELIGECALISPARLAPLSREADELLAITVASIRTARANRAANPQSAIRNPQCS